MKKELMNMDERMRKTENTLGLSAEDEKYLKKNLLYRMIMLFD